ncbi:acetyl-CoA carboxylase biotin carboxyl carrier protein [Treponema vincentii]|uniref:acetyl-CoA carboxylase biotin carboxyl carrier protein n=1 Tax=Treponema vincentii TaxID=69710 RepID=UPI0035F5C7A9
MNEKFILNVFDKFEKSSAVLLHIKEGEAELTLKKEAAYQNVPAVQPFVLRNSPAQPVLPADANGYAAAGVGVPNSAASAANPAAAGMQGSAAGSTGTGTNQLGATSAGTVNATAGMSGADAHLVTVKSPIVGSFYRSPSPDAPAYVEKGSKVSKGQPLCILEAMKMMNTLECEYDGTVEEILAANGDLVEFDQPLFTIRI